MWARACLRGARAASVLAPFAMLIEGLRRNEKGPPPEEPGAGLGLRMGVCQQALGEK